MSDITIEKLQKFIFSVTAENFDIETLEQALLLIESLELTREQRDGILQITEVLEDGFFLHDRTSRTNSSICWDIFTRCLL